MALSKPLRRTVRQLIDGTYSNSGHWRYLLHPKYANDPQHYIRAFLLIQEDLQTLFKYVEPCDQNLTTISLKIQELLVRVCIEIEANFTAILMENTYSNSGNLNIKNDYCFIEFSHRLSSYEVKFPTWIGEQNSFTPFANWANHPEDNWHVLDWYQSYNKSKHDRHNHFDKATFNNLLNAVAGLVVVLSAQFMDENYSPNMKSMGIGGGYSYGYDPTMETAIGDYLRVKFPTDWPDEEKYDFNWQELEDEEEPIDLVNYDFIKAQYT